MQNACMTPAQFIALWQNNPLTERAGAQGHFDDLCELLGVDKPRDPTTTVSSAAPARPAARKATAAGPTSGSAAASAGRTSAPGATCAPR
jgi:hypothetical protein